MKNTTGTALKNLLVSFASTAVLVWPSLSDASAVASAMASAMASDQAINQGIRIDPHNPRYWTYGGTRTVLIGGTGQDNLFQMDELEAKLDLLASVGGNYVRNTMSSRDAPNLWPYQQRLATDGRPVDALSGMERLVDRLRSWYRNGSSVYPKYDLAVFDEAYWDKFDTLLRLAKARDIVVQIEIWDRFDYAREPWLKNPFNPMNNASYASSTSGLLTEYPDHPGLNMNAFFRTIPELLNKPALLVHQHTLIDKLLSISLRYDNVLYTISNETSGDEAWSAYWARYIRGIAASKGKTVYITEMWDPWNLNDPKHSRTFDHPELYDFVDVSQNNHQRGESHWRNLVSQWHRLSGDPRPINNVKIYGADGGRFGTTSDALDRFWQSLLGGSASARFHRDEGNAGLGLGEIAQHHLASAAALIATVDITALEPQRDVLVDAQGNQAFVTGSVDQGLVLYVPAGGDFAMPVDRAGTFPGQWLHPGNGSWHTVELVASNGLLAISAPTDTDKWVLVVAPSSRAGGVVPTSAKRQTRLPDRTTAATSQPAPARGLR